MLFYPIERPATDLVPRVFRGLGSTLTLIPVPPEYCVGMTMVARRPYGKGADGHEHG